MTSDKQTPKKRAGSYILAFFHAVKVELALTNWPTRQETTRLTLVIIIATALIGMYIGGLDLIFTNLLTKLLTK